MDAGAKPEDHATAVVLIVDDDELVRISIAGLIRSAGYQTAVYASAAELLSSPLPEGVCCLVTDVRLPRLSGLDLQVELKKRGKRLPVIFMTGHGDIPMSVKAMKAGAIDFLPKPFRDQDMLDAIRTALALDVTNREADDRLAECRTRFDSLTARERQVLQLVASGLLNKQAAGELGLSEVTIKLHRGNAMRKLGTRTLAQAVRMLELIERRLGA